MLVPPADHSKWLLPSLANIANSFGLCMDSWLNSNQGKAITRVPILWEVLWWAPPTPHGCTDTALGKSMRQCIAPD